MNKDVDERLIPNGEMVNAENIRVASSEGANVGAIENVLGNEQLTNISLGTTPVCVGAYTDHSTDKLYWMVLDTTPSDPHCWILEWDDVTGTLTKIAEDNRPAATNVLNFQEDNLITAIDMVIDTDNDRRFLIWSDDVNQPKMANVERLKKIAVNTYDEDDVSLIKRPPLSPPTTELVDTSSVQNNLLERFFAFGYRYRYEDEMYSAISPLSPYAFEARNFQFDYSTSSNESMVNKFNAVKLTFSTGPRQVEAIELVYKESGSNNYYLIQTFDKEQEGWADDTNATFTFVNDKTYTALPSEELNKLYDNVPIKAKALQVINGRIVFGNYLEGYDIETSGGAPIKMDFNLSSKQTAITEGTPTKSIKSNRSYEAALVYLDEYGRASAPLPSKDNTTFIPNEHADKQNQLELTIRNTPPSWATNYRIYLKQSTEDYDVITPSIFYNDGVFTWIRLEGNDQDKISEGSFLWVKSDSDGILEEAVQTEVLEIATQPRNFLEPTTDDETETLQEPGVYFRIKARGFQINSANSVVYEQSTKGYRSRSIKNPVQSPTDYLESPAYYGDSTNPGLDDLTLPTPTVYTGTEDIRYIIEIDGTGTPDTFRYSDDGGDTFTSGIPVTGGSQNLTNGVAIQFGATTGHSTGDQWIVSAKSADVVQAFNDEGDNYLDTRSTWTYFQGKEAGNEVIEGGSLIRIAYKEILRPDTGNNDDIIIEDYDTTFIVTQQYNNIEEWWYGDGIEQQIEWPANNEGKVFFRRGKAVKDKNEQISMVDLTNAPLFMIFESRADARLSQVVEVNGFIEVTEYKNPIIFETKGVNNEAEIFYEIGETYNITGGFHQGDTNQDATTDAVVTMDIYNAFAWGNGFESYKIRDKFTERGFKLDYRFNVSVENYRSNRRIASLLHGDRYEQSTNFNGLNSFNIFQATPIWKDLDDRYGSIQILKSWNTNLLAFQEDKVHNILIDKSILFNADGSEQVQQIDQVFGQERAYAGEYGISQNPESLAVFGNYVYWIDTNRGTPLRLAGDGISEINYGMEDFFRDTLNAEQLSDKLGGYDPHNDEYVVSIKDQDRTVTPILECGGSFNKYQETDNLTFTVEIDSFTNNVDINFNVGSGNIAFEATFDGTTTNSGESLGELTALTGSGTFSIATANLDVRTLSVTAYVSGSTSDGGLGLSNLSGQADYSVSVSCDSVDTTNVYLVFVANRQFFEFIERNPGFLTQVRYQPDFNTTWGVDDGVNVPYTLQEEGGIASFTKITYPTSDPVSPDTGFNYIGFRVSTASQLSKIWDTTAGHRLGHLYTSTDYGPGDLDALVAAATFNSSLATVELGAVVQEEFNIASLTSGNNLYLIWDFRGNTLVATDDSVTVTENRYEDIDVLENDTFTGGPVTITIASQPSNGTAQVLTNGRVRYWSTGGTGADSFTYTISNGSTTDTATVNVTVNADTGGGTGATGVAVSMQTTGDSLQADSCGTALGTTRYHDGPYTTPRLDDFIYTDVNKTTAFNGNNLWYAIANGRTLKIDTLGRVVQEWYCGLQDEDTDFYFTDS